jgi:hypothetical protein
MYRIGHFSGTSASDYVAGLSGRRWFVEDVRSGLRLGLTGLISNKAVGEAGEIWSKDYIETAQKNV